MFDRLVWVLLGFFYCSPSLLASEVIEVSIMHIGKITLDKTRKIPLIEAKIAGIDTRIMLDTGSHPATLTEYFARKIGLSLPEKPVIGEPMVFFEKQNLSFQLGPISSLWKEFAVIQQHDNFYKKNNIGAIYNPNLFTCGNCLIVLDFINRELYAAQTERAEDLSAVLDGRYAGLKKISAPYVQNDISMLHISGVSGNHQSPGIALLDTGANVSSFLQSSVGDVKIVNTSYVTNIIGSVRNREETTPIAVSIGGVVLANIAVTVEKKLDGTVNNGEDLSVVRQAEIGMDVMKNCAVAIESKKAVHFYCKTLTN